MAVDEEGGEIFLVREGKQGIYEEEMPWKRYMSEIVEDRNHERERKEDGESINEGKRDQHKELYELRRDTSYGQEQEEVIGGNNPLGFLAAGLRLLSFLVNNLFRKRETNTES